MHAVLFVCLPRTEARNSLQARKQVCDYLTQEGFDSDLRFAGRCDYFGVGGRCSGRLSLLRLRYEDPKRFDRFWKKFCMTKTTAEQAKQLFRETFPGYKGKLPICREGTDFHGEPDDAQIMDEPLFQQLKAGFSEDVSYAYDIKEPNVIFMGGPDPSEWPKTNKEAAKFWVVVIDYHD